MPRRRLLFILALLGVLATILWSVWPTADPRLSTGTEYNDRLDERDPSRPDRAGPPGNLNGSVLALGEPVPGASVWVTDAGGALGREPCPCGFEETDLLLDLFCDCAEAEELLTDAILAGHGEPDPLATADTAADGTFAVLGLPAGEFTLWAEHETAGIGVLAGVRVGDGHVVIDLEAATLFGGIVIGDADEPVADTEIVVVDTLSNRFSYTSSDADGHFEVLTHAEGEYFLVASADGYFPTLEFFFPDEDDLEVYLDSPRRIAGRVLHSDNTPASGVDVTLRGWGKRTTVASDRRGRFGFEDIRPGEYYVMAERRRQLDGKRIEVLPGEDRTNVTLRLRHVDGGELFGVVRDDSGEGIAGARVVVIGDDAWGEDAVTTDDSGRYQIRPLAVGYYDLEAEAPSRGKACAEVDILASEPTEVDLVLGEGALASGIVFMADGSPVARAPIWLERTDEDLGYDEDYLDSEFEDRAVDEDSETYDYEYDYDYDSTLLLDCGEQETATAADGTFVLHGSAGEYMLVVMYGGPSPYEERVTLPNAALRIEVPPHATVRGQVVDARGRPVALAMLSLVSPDGLANPYEADDEGRFELEGLVDGQYELRADAAAGLAPTAATTFDVRAGEGPDDLLLRFTPGMHISGQVTLPDGEPVLSGMVRATHVDSLGMGHADLANGEFLFEDVPGGTFILEAFVPGYPVVDLTARGGDSNVDITLTLGRSVSGRVVDAQSGGPIADATVSAALEHGPTDSVPITGTDASGNFTLENLSRREVLLTVAINSVPVHQSWVAPSRSHILMTVEPPEKVDDDDEPLDADPTSDVDLWDDEASYY
jgi:hypothetical protein